MVHGAHAATHGVGYSRGISLAGDMMDDDVTASIGDLIAEATALVADGPDVLLALEQALHARYRARPLPLAR